MVVVCADRGRGQRKKGRAGGPEANAVTILVGLCLRLGEVRVRKYG